MPNLSRQNTEDDEYIEYLAVKRRKGVSDVELAICTCAEASVSREPWEHREHSVPNCSSLQILTTDHSLQVTDMLSRLGPRRVAQLVPLTRGFAFSARRGARVPEDNVTRIERVMALGGAFTTLTSSSKAEQPLRAQKSLVPTTLTSSSLYDSEGQAHTLRRYMRRLRSVLIHPCRLRGEWQTAM